MPRTLVSKAQNRSSSKTFVSQPLFVQAICIAVKQWEYKGQHTTPVCSHLVTAPVVPVLKVKNVVNSDNSDQMLSLEQFSQIWQLIPYQFTLDTCCNPNGDNHLCECYYSTYDSFIRRDLTDEFVWMNPLIEGANSFLDHYFCGTFWAR